MKKRIVTLLILCSFLLTTPVLAVQESTDHFVRMNTYSGQFSDLSRDSTFYDNVSALYEYGLSVGKTDGTYGLADSLTVGQAVIFAGRIRSIYRTGDPEAGPSAYQQSGQLTAARYLRYLQAEGVLDTALDSRLTAAATRAEMAHILAGILPEKDLPSIHSNIIAKSVFSRCAIPDVTSSTPYYQDILALYSKGICIGNNAVGSFSPNASITRGAAAAMITRIVDPSLRVSPQWDISAKNLKYSSWIPSGTLISAPSTAEEMDSAIRYMLSRNENQLKLQYGPITADEVRSLMLLALEQVKQYCEQSYNMIYTTYTPQGSVTFTFSAAGISPDPIASYRNTTLAAAITVHDRLWVDGTITADMTETEKALAYYTWVCENCVYDETADDESISHIPYSLFQLGTAVCDGYTGAYNLLLRLEGIDCTALSQDEHIWTVAQLDGQEVHIDTTWGDSQSEIDYEFFAMTPEESWNHHPWKQMKPRQNGGVFACFQFCASSL